MSDFPFATIGFDLDGTLADTVPDLAPAVNHALAQIGRGPISPEETRNLVGGGSRLMLERALKVSGGMVEEDRFGDLYAALLEYYEAHIADHTMLYPGCRDALDALAGQGCKLAVVTNKPEFLSLKLLAELGIRDMFDSVLGGDTLGPGRAKPAPDMIHQTIALCGGEGAFAMIGDSSFDVRAAQAAGAPCVLLSFGYHDAPPHSLGADAVIDHFGELIPALEELAPR